MYTLPFLSSVSSGFQSTAWCLNYGCEAKTYLLTTEHPSQKRFTLERTFIPRTCPIRPPIKADSVGRRDERSENARDMVVDELVEAMGEAIRGARAAGVGRSDVVGRWVQRELDEHARVDGPA